MASVVQTITTSMPSTSFTAAPEAVQKWLRQEDWEALTRAWQEAEAQAIAWVEASDGEQAKMELLQEASQASLQSTSVQSLPPLSQVSSKTRRRRRPKWNEDFHLLGLDRRRPPPLRRYFDKLPSETTLPRDLHGEGSQRKTLPERGGGASFQVAEHLKARKSWVQTHHQTVSPDNEALHPHLRSYFDRRGLESCYREKPMVDQSTKKLRPRTPQRPTTRERLLKFSQSEPSLTQDSRWDVHLDVHWGARCQRYGTDEIKVKPLVVDGNVEKIPWVTDHHCSVSHDNDGLNPMLRHYFDADGLESSFRNRGMQYGREGKARGPWARLIAGIDDSRGSKSQKSRKGIDSGSSGYDSARSSLIDKLSHSSL